MSEYYDVGYDELGYDELGDDDAGEYGALESGALKRRLPARRSAGRNMRNMPRPRHANRLMLLPVNQAVAIGAGALGQATGFPQKVFKPLRLIIGTRTDTVGTFTETITAAGWLVQQITIGATPQSVAQGGIVGDLFLAVAVETNFEFDTAQIGHQIIVQITNNGTLAHPFFGTFIGKAINLPQVL
jgi:hypothetical protein